MIIFALTTGLGAIFGGWLAYRRKGNGFDIAQYAAVFAIIGFIVGAIFTIILARSMGI